MTDRQRERLCAALKAHLAGGRPLAPEGSSPLWNGFMALSRARTCGPGGANPISFPEILAWARLMRVPLEPHHVEILTAMDQVWLQDFYGKATGKPPATPLTAAAFDAWHG
ncbi:MAG: hypothetical protein CL868_13090 [Cytophagaceae bacterium]|nr:hypothetical protein [Cytophagaceae bacterium]